MTQEAQAPAPSGAPEGQVVGQTATQAPTPEPAQNPSETPAEQPPASPEPTGSTQEPTKPKLDIAKAANGIEPMLKDAGLDPAEVARAVIGEGGSVTPEILKALEEKHGEGVAGLISDKLAAIYDADRSAANERDTAVFNQLEKEFEGVTDQSGKDTWKELSGWAKTNMQDSERAEINALLKQGGLSAKLAVQELVARFKESDSFTQPAVGIDPDGMSNEFGKNLIGKREYHTELNKLLDAGHDYNTSPEIKALDRRRNKSIARGHN